MIKRCVIITAFLDCKLSEIYTKEESDYVICADGGITIAEESGVIPDIVLGDLDSTSCVNEKYNFIKFPKEKDDTDTLLCLKYGMEKGFKDFVIIGGIGGRFDHTLANIQTLAYALSHNAKASIITKDAICQMISDDESIKLEKKEEFYLSLFSYSQKCEGITIEGVKYCLENASLTNSFPLGVSNEFKDDVAKISIKKGTLLVVLSRE